MKTRLFAAMLCSVLITFAICGPTLAAKRRAVTLVDIVPIPKLRSLKGCPVSARVNPAGAYQVNFRKFPSGQAWITRTTANTGKVNIIIPWGLKIYADVPSGPAQSLPFVCPAQNSTK